MCAMVETPVEGSILGLFRVLIQGLLGSMFGFLDHRAHGVELSSSLPLNEAIE